MIKYLTFTLYDVCEMRYEVQIEDDVYVMCWLKWCKKYQLFRIKSWGSASVCDVTEAFKAIAIKCIITQPIYARLK